jgi:alkylation response protein AidB-like acyl-CoA dehydrogenase
MNYEDSPDEAAFRAELRQWLAATLPGLPKATSDADRRHVAQSWHQALYAAGYIGLSIPAHLGGQGQPAMYEAILNEEVGRANAPDLPPSIGYLARALALYGTQEQRDAYLPDFISGRVVWCQGFSEPDAGSDLAGLRTVAIQDGDHYVVNGQKIWNGGADYAKYCFLLCRTNPELPRHQGISVLIVDMNSEGVDARPIRKISGRPDFAEIFFTDVRVPVQNRIGEEGRGWNIAMGTLGYERGPSDTGFVAQFQALLESVEAEYHAGRLRELPDAGVRLARAHMILDALVRHVQRSLSERDEETPPGSESSIDKLLMIRTQQELLHIVTDLVGTNTWNGREDLQNAYVWSRAASIYGGTEQIQLNIVAQRVLGLPRT